MAGPGQPAVGLEEPLNEPVGCDRIDCVTAADGVELLQARLKGRAYARHRHDTYAVCVTDRGVQIFDYRGEARISLPGQVVVLYPDEPHDGRPGTGDGFAYRIVYLSPMRLGAAVRSIVGRPAALPFLPDPVSASPVLRRAIEAAFRCFPAPLEPLAVDALIGQVADGLLGSAGSAAAIGPARLDSAGLERVRRHLEAERTRIVTSEELETIGGHDRFQLARQFRRLHGTSPYRYLMMRRLERVREEIRTGKPLAAIAIDCGFADQAHMTRNFKASLGLTPAQYRAATR
jgi:AraC-like DNA-binding protein